MPQRPSTTLGIAASVSTSAVTGPLRKFGESSVRNSAIPIASGAARMSAPSEVIAVPKRKLPAPYSSRPSTGFQATRVTNARPYLLIAGQAASKTFQIISPTRTVTASAAAPATTEAQGRQIAPAAP